MEIRVRATGAVMFEDEFRRWLLANGGPSFDVLSPEIMEAVEADPVLEGPQPEAGRYQTIYRDGVEEIEGQWFTKYAVAEMDDEAKAAVDERQKVAVRKDRNDRLSGSDWTQLADAPGDKIAWGAYRQALRDVPSQPGFPWDVNWPTAP